MKHHMRCEKCGRYEPATMTNPYYPMLPDGWRKMFLSDERVNYAMPSEFIVALCGSCWSDVWATVTRMLAHKDKP